MTLRTFCPVCGATLTGGAQFCGNCGTQLTAAPSSAAPEMPLGDSNVVGLRIVAALIDFIPLIVLFLVMAATLGEFGNTGPNSNFEVRLENEQFLLYALIAYLYYVIFEAATAATPGKMLMGLTVVKVNGEPYTVGAVLLRNILRLIDGLFFYVVAIVCMAVTAKRQRLGDLAAGTLVVRVNASPVVRPLD
jgi:uncharacterized RDD family membrane protein YckC